MSKFKHIIWHYFVSYMLVLLPLLVISFVVTNISNSRMEKEEEQEVQRQLDMLAEDMGGWYKNHFENSVVLAQDSMISSRNVLNDSGLAAEVIAYLNSIRLFDNGVSDIFVYYGEGALYGAKGKSRPSAYFGGTLSCQEDIASKAENFIGASESGVIFLNTKTAESYLLYHFPTVGYQGYRAIHYLLPVSYWEKQAKMIFGEAPIALCLNVGTDRVWIVGKEEEQCEEDNNYIRLKRETGTADMSLELIYNVRFAYKDLRRIQNLNLFILAFGGVMSSIVSISMSRHDGKKIMQFSKMVKNKEIVSPNGKGFPRNFDYIQEMLVQLLKENSQISMNMKDCRQIMLNQAARLLFHGLLKDNVATNQLFKDLGRE